MQKPYPPKDGLPSSLAFIMMPIEAKDPLIPFCVPAIFQVVGKPVMASGARSQFQLVSLISYCWAWMLSHLQFASSRWLNGDFCQSTMLHNTRKLFLTVKGLHVVDQDICWSGGTPHPIRHSFLVPIPANGGVFLGMICWLIYKLKGRKSLKVINIWELLLYLLCLKWYILNREDMHR